MNKECNRFKGRVAIVTAGASGIGKATSKLLASEGADVVIIDANIEGANKVVDEIKALRCHAVAMKVDVTSYDEASKMAKATLDKFGKIDILLNIVGGAIKEKIGPFAQSNKEDWCKTIDLNLFSTLNCTRAVVNHMMERRSGKIVNIASVGAVVGQKNTADYAAAKGGIIAFTKSLAKEVAPYGINVNCVSPGPIATPRALAFPEEMIQRQIKMVHLGRYGKPEEVAAMIAFLASDEASYITGANFLVDGGISLSY